MKFTPWFLKVVAPLVVAVLPVTVRSASDAAPAPAPLVLPASVAPAPEFWSVAVADTLMRRHADFAKAYHNSWTYVNGYVLAAFDRLSRATGDRRYVEFLQQYIDRFVDERGGFRAVMNAKGVERVPSFNNLDNMMTGHTLVLLHERTHDERYRTAATTIRRALDAYPRNSDGGFWHSVRLPGEMWIDGIFMGQMFLTRYGHSIADREYAFDEAAKQLLVYARRGRAASGLYVHGAYEPGHRETPAPKWADPKTGLSPEVWSEGLGWYALVLVETLELMPRTHPEREALVAILRQLAADLRRFQDPKTGCWFQVVDKPDAPGNWTDTSGSAMFTYTIQRGIELGLLPAAEYADVVRRGYAGIVSFARVNAEGLVDIYSACDGLGVQPSYDAYIQYPRKVNAKEAVAGFLWATALVERPALEARRLHPAEPARK